MTETSGKRRTSAVARLAALLILIPVAGCDNVEWGGVQVAIVPPPARAEAPAADIEAAERLPDGPIVYYVRRDSATLEVIPVGVVVDQGMQPIDPGGDLEGFGSRFIAAYLRQGAELTLFHRGRRAGTLIVDSAYVPTGDVCRGLPRATGSVELGGAAAEATEFIAMARPQAPDGRALPGEPEVERRMQVLGPIMAERALRARGAQLPNWSTALRQIFPFPVSEARDLAFTSTFLVDDELAVGNDTLGYSLFVLYTPQAQTGYDTAYVSHVSYPEQGKQAPRVIDFLDWTRDGTPELLLEVYGTDDSWFEAVGQVEGDWQRVLQARCRAPAPAIAADTTAAPGDTVAGSRPATRPATPPAQRQTAPPQQQTAPPGDTAAQAQVPIPEPRVRLTPGSRPTRPDTTGGQ